MKRQLIIYLCTMVLLLVTASSATAQSSIPNLEVVILLDDSGSMWQYTDPEEWRTNAVELLINSLGVDRSQADFRVAVISFNSSPQLIEDRFFNIDDSLERETLLASLASQRVAPASLTNAWTDVLLALQEAERLLQDSHDDRFKPVIILVTDGQPETETHNQDNPEALALYTEDVRTEALTAFQGFGFASERCGLTSGAPIYTLAIRLADTVGDYRAEDRLLWQDISRATNGNYYEILAATASEFQQELQKQFDDLTAEMLCQGQPADIPFEPVSEDSSHTFYIDSIHESVTFNVQKTQDSISVTIRNPNNDIVGLSGEDVPAFDAIYETDRAPRSRDVNESWGFRRPDDRENWVGTWTVELDLSEGGDAEVQVLARVTSRTVSDVVTVDIVEPASNFVPTGGQVVIELHIDSEALTDIVDKDVTYAIVCGDNKTYVGTDPEVLGNVILGLINVSGASSESCELVADVIVMVDGEEYTVSTAKDVTLDENTPRLDIISPVQGETYEINELSEIEARLMTGNLEYQSLGRDVVIATLYQGEEVIRKFTLKHAPDRGAAVYAAPVDGEPIPAGEYRLRLSLAAFPPGFPNPLPPQQTDIRFSVNSQRATATSVIALPPTPEPVATATSTSIPSPTALPSSNVPFDIPVWYYVVCGGVLLVLTIAILLWFAINSSGYTGGLFIDETGMGNDFQVRRRRLFVPPQIIRDMNGEELARLQVEAGENRDRVLLLSLAEGVTAHHRGLPLEVKEEFYPEPDDEIRIGPVILRYDAEHLEDELLGQDEEEAFDQGSGA